MWLSAVRQNVRTLDLCRRLLVDPGAPALALTLHNIHARHARELGEHEIAERAEERYGRALRRQLRVVRTSVGSGKERG